MPRKVVNFDLRHPAELSVSGADTYRTALQIAAWADRNGFERIGLAEHHQNPDGYLPCPLLFASAVGGCTSQIKVRTGVVLAPLYDPVRLAEEVAVADLCTGGRLVLGMGLGSQPGDFAAFGMDIAARGRTMDQLIPFLRRAWTGEPFEHRGVEVRVTPRPVQDPMPIYLGGTTRAAADRAARLADGFHTATAEHWELYRDACRRYGKPDPGPREARGPMFLWVTTDDKAKVRAELEPSFRYQEQSYVDQTTQAGIAFRGPWVRGPGTPEPYRVLDPDEAIELANDLGPEGELIFHPLLAGIEPAKVMRMLELVERAVLPHLAH